MTPGRIVAAFEIQSAYCIRLGSDFTGRLCRLAAMRPWPKGAVRDRIFDWPGDPSNRADAVPLRWAGALHALRLADQAGLARAYPPHDVGDDELWDTVAAAMTDHAPAICAMLDSPPQTNDVRRAATIIAAAHLLHDIHPLPFRITELGASGGLNLMFDRFALALPDRTLGAADPVLTLTPDWTGPSPPARAPLILDRAGVDLNPLDPSRPADALRLQAYLWPDQPHRLTMTRAAMTVAAGPVTRSDAIDWLPTRLTHIPGQLHLIYHSVAWQYFPPDVQDRGRAMIAAHGANATADTPLAWFAMEGDATPEQGAALTLRLWPGDITVPLGRADFHGRWVNWAGLHSAAG